MEREGVGRGGGAVSRSFGTETSGWMGCEVGWKRCVVGSEMGRGRRGI
jgi:hypothetical protein